VREKTGEGAVGLHRKNVLWTCGIASWQVWLLNKSP
jgi:hypothetical protein